MKSFIDKHKKDIIGVLSGWDRIVFRGTFRLVANLAGMHQYLSYLGVLMKDFKQYAQEKTAELIRASVAKAERGADPICICRPLGRVKNPSLWTSPLATPSPRD